MNDGKICCEYLLYYIKLLNCDILLCKNVVIRNWYGKYLCVNEKKNIFKNIIIWWYLFLECNFSFFKIKRESVRKINLVKIV